MIISAKRNYIFVHAPKTGGTSLALALEARAASDDIMLGDTPKALRRRRRMRDVQTRGRLWKHSTLADIDGLISPDQIAGMFVFTLVRNPWARMVSYYFWLRAQRFDHPAVALAGQLGFADFACHAQTRAALHAAPARHYVTDVRGTERCQAFIRLEHLAQDLAPVETHLGFALNVPRANPSDRPEDWRSVYDQASRVAVEESCGEDIERFGYAFDTPDFPPKYILQ